MTYIRKSSIVEQKEACQKAEKLSAICESLCIPLDPIDWQNAGMRAVVKVNAIPVADLLNLSQQDSDSILRQVRIKLFERAACKAIHARPGLKALIWSPVEVIQPQEFSSLWIITLETYERVAIAEYIRDERRVYEPYQLEGTDAEHLARLFGPMQSGTYQPGQSVTIEERERKYSGEIVYILPAGKATPGRKYPGSGSHANLSKVYSNERYLVDCHDGFPHIANQSQVVISSEALVQ